MENSVLEESTEVRTPPVPQWTPVKSCFLPPPPPFPGQGQDIDSFNDETFGEGATGKGPGACRHRGAMVVWVGELSCRETTPSWSCKPNAS